MQYREIHPDGTEYSVERDEPFTLEELYDILNCETIEVIYPECGSIMIMDEEGWDEPENDEASTIAGQTIKGIVIIADEGLLE